MATYSSSLRAVARYNRCSFQYNCQRGTTKALVNNVSTTIQVQQKRHFSNHHLSNNVVKLESTAPYRSISNSLCFLPGYERRSTATVTMEARREKRRHLSQTTKQRKDDKIDDKDNILKKSSNIYKDKSKADPSGSSASKENSIFPDFDTFNIDFTKKVKLFDDVEWDAKKYTLKRQWRRKAGRVFSVMGFVSSASKALLADVTQLKRVWLPAYEALMKFLQTSGIDLELQSLLNRRLLDNVILLGIIQKQALQNESGMNYHDRRDDVLLEKKLQNIPSNEDALRYMKFATSAYGESMIRAAEMDLTGKFNTSALTLTLLPGDDATNTTRLRTRIRNHCKLLSDDDIVVMDVDFGGNVEHLRHFVAIDHERKEVILAIRGTFSLAEVVVDAAGFSRPFCDGEGHSEMCNMAEKLWDVVGSTILEILEQHQGYKFTIVGHSLGAGTATLLNIFLHHNQRDLIKRHEVRCIAFACPPVFTPLGKAREAVKACTNYIHENDCVSFLSVDSVRHLFNCIRAIEQQNMKWLDRIRLITKSKKPHRDLIDVVNRAHKNRLKPKPGAPVLAIPAFGNIWLKEDIDAIPAVYNMKVCDSVKLAHLGIFIDSDMFEDHYPSRYEHAFQNLRGR